MANKVVVPNRQKTNSLVGKHVNREIGWQNVGYPISMHNEKNHFSKKLKFEDI